MVAEGKVPFPWMHITDEQILLSIAQDGSGITALTYFRSDAEEMLRSHPSLGNDLQIRNDGFFHALLRDPNGVAIWLIQGDPAKVYAPKQTPIGRCGHLGEISIEADDLVQTIEFWKSLGFSVTHQHPTAPWATMTDSIITLGIYQRGICPHQFRNPSITYFEPDMRDRIAAFKADGFVFLEEIPNAEGVVAEAIADAPDGPLFFLFTS